MSVEHDTSEARRAPRFGPMPSTPWRLRAGRSIVVTFLVLATACAGSPAETSSTSTTTLRSTTSTPATAPTTTRPAPPSPYGGSVVIADDQFPPTLNPFAAGGDHFIVTIIGQLHLAGAYDIDAATLDYVPELVTEFPSVANGGVVVNDDGTMTVRYRIRDEATWSDGVPITGADFAHTLDLEQRSPCLNREAQFDIEVEEVGEKTIAVRYSQPTLRYEQLFGWVVPRHAVEGSDLCVDWNDWMWPAAGPFVLDEFVPEDRVTFLRNENYWKVEEATGDRLPYLDAVEIRFIPDTERIIDAFRKREVDVIQPPPWIDWIEELRGLDGADVQVLEGPVWEHINFSFGEANRNPSSLNRYREYRRAVVFGLDRDRLIRDVGIIPLDLAADSILVGNAAAASSDPWAQYGHDEERAAELLLAACDLAGRECRAEPPRLVFSTTSNGDVRIRVAEQLEAQLTPLGFDVELQLEDSQLFFGETLDSADWDVGLWAWVASPGASALLATMDLFDPDAPPPDGSNYYRWGTPGSVNEGEDAVERFRLMLAELRTTIDRDRAFALAAEMEQLLADEAVVIPIYNRATVGAVWADEVAGFTMNPTQAGHTWNIEYWRRLDN